MLGHEINPIEIWEIERLARGLGDPTIEAEVAFNHARGLLHEHGDLDAARAKLLRAQSLVRDHGAAAHLAQQIRIDFGMIALWTGDTAVAREQFTEAMTAARAARDRAFEALALNNLGEASRFAGADVEAAACYEESLRLYHALGARTEIPRLLHNLGYLALHGGDLALARTRFAESFAGFRDVAVARGMAEAVAGLAAAAACLGTPEAARAAGRLWGAAAAALAGEGLPIWPADQAEWNRYQPLAQKVLNGADFAAAQTAGRCLSLETAASEAGLP